jgi:GTPase SAR1 family protein
MEAEELHPAAKPPEGQRRDVVLWDFGGQDEYQLVHQMFLQDTTLALVLIDPTRGRAALDEARDWNKRLEKHLGMDRSVKLLVGAKVDDARRSKLIDMNGIEKLKKECGFDAFIDLSAKKGRNTKKLRKLISDKLNWDEMAKTSRPELFQHIRDDIEARRKKKQIILTLDAFKRAIKKSATKLFEEAAVEAVSDQLSTQGIIVRTKLSGGDEALVLQLPVIERYAGSLIIAARNNARGVPVLEERLLSSTKTIPLPGMTKKERLSPAKERMVLECIVELMIQHGICFRHGGLLVFPTLFPAGEEDDEKLPHSVSLYYDFTGAIDNIYASLVSKLMVSEEFGEGRLRAGRVEFERGRQGVCGVRQIKRPGGLAHIDLFFSEKTKPARKDLFTRFVEEHLRTHGVEIREHQAIKCLCGEEIPERIVQTRISVGATDVVCPICERKASISEGVDRIRERSPETDEKMVALRKTIDEKLAQDIESAKKVVAGEIRVATTGDPIRILHVSDLHFSSKTNPDTIRRLLLQDIRGQDEDYPAIETVEYLVISGDMTDKGSDTGFEKARHFVETLVKELGLSVERCIFVPGNHDVQDRADAYEEREAEDGTAIKVRHPVNFPKRFEQFSNGFFHPLIQHEYPLSYSDQGISYLFPDTCIQFLTLNSAWEIDRNARKKAGIHPDAVAGVIAKADEERKRAVERDHLKNTQPILRIGVWHHAVAGPELMKDLGFLTQLQKAGMRVCLHGDVHEQRTELFGHRRPGIDVEVLGAGSFGSAAEGRPESTPRLYNMLEVAFDQKTKQHLSIRVHTRQQKKENESWQGYHEWPKPKGGRIPFFDIGLK